MGMVDENNRVNFYDGAIRVIDANGAEIERFAPADYAAIIAEHVEPWSYIKFPYLRKRGWKGFAEGVDEQHLPRFAAGATQCRRRHGDAAQPGAV